VEAAWVVVLWWGERRVFKSAIEACQWDRWEDWVFAPWDLSRREGEEVHVFVG